MYVHDHILFVLLVILYELDSTHYCRSLLTLLGKGQFVFLSKLCNVIAVMLKLIQNSCNKHMYLTRLNSTNGSVRSKSLTHNRNMEMPHC